MSILLLFPMSNCASGTVRVELQTLTIGPKLTISLGQADKRNRSMNIRSRPELEQSWPWRGMIRRAGAALCSCTSLFLFFFLPRISCTGSCMHAAGGHVVSLQKQKQKQKNVFITAQWTCPKQSIFRLRALRKAQNVTTELPRMP